MLVTAPKVLSEVGFSVCLILSSLPLPHAYPAPNFKEDTLTRQSYRLGSCCALAVITKYCRLNDLKRPLLSHGFGGWRSQMQVWGCVGLFLLRAVRACPCPTSAPGGLLPVLDVPWLLLHHPDPFFHLHMAFFLWGCLHVHTPSFHRKSLYWKRLPAHLH